MTPAIASERSIFSKNHDWNSYIEFPCRGEHVRTYISGCRCTRWQKTIYKQTHTHTRDSHSDDIKRCSSIGIIQRTVYTYAKPLNMKHMCYSGIIIKRNFFTRKQTCNGEYTKHCTRSRHQLKMAAPAEVSEKRSNF